jgi:hypothetical protein
VPAFLELAPDALEVVELAVRDDAKTAILARNRLIAGRQVDDAEPRMPEPGPTPWVDPNALRVRAAMMEPARRAEERFARYGAVARDGCNDTAHLGVRR